jgi:predicted HTH domain antitoxin
MEDIQCVPKTDLARKTRQVIRNVQARPDCSGEKSRAGRNGHSGYLDYRILRAFMAYHARPPKVNPQGLDSKLLEGLDDSQKGCDLILVHYLDGAINLGRAAELLDLPAVELQVRFQRLDVPFKLGPEDKPATLDEVSAARDSQA